MPEERITDPTTGGQKGRKQERFDLLPPGPLEQIARHYGIGAEKYEDRNWEKGYDWSLSYGALQRHLWAWWAGEDDDPENGSPHLAAAAFHVLALLEFAVTHPEKDDRPTSPPNPDLSNASTYDPDHHHVSFDSHLAKRLPHWGTTW